MGRVPKETRGSYYGIKSATTMSKVTITKLEGLRAKVEKMAEPWGEADQMIGQSTDKVVAANELIQQYKDSAVYMNETMDD